MWLTLNGEGVGEGLAEAEAVPGLTDVGVRQASVEGGQGQLLPLPHHLARVLAHPLHGGGRVGRDPAGQQDALTLAQAQLLALGCDPWRVWKIISENITKVSEPEPPGAGVFGYSWSSHFASAPA